MAHWWPLSHYQKNRTVCYLPEVLRYIVLQLALHQMSKQRLDLVEDTLLWLVCVILDGQESLRWKTNSHWYKIHCVKQGVDQMLCGEYRKQTADVHLWQAWLHVELLEDSIHVTCGSSVLQSNKTWDWSALHRGQILTRTQETLVSHTHKKYWTTNIMARNAFPSMSYIKLLAEGRIGLVVHGQ